MPEVEEVEFKLEGGGRRWREVEGGAPEAWTSGSLWEAPHLYPGGGWENCWETQFFCVFAFMDISKVKFRKKRKTKSRLDCS